MEPALPEQTNATLTLSNIQMEQAGTYSVVVSNSLGIASCSATLDVVPVWVWGNNSNGQTNVPAGLSNVVAVATGARHCLALNADGTIIAWGKNLAVKPTCRHQP